MSNQARQLAFVLVPGGHCLPGVFETLADSLRKHNYEANAIYLPSVGRDRSLSDHGTGPASLYDDAAYLNSVGLSLIQSGRDVVFVGNSYGGFVISEGSRGLNRVELETTGQYNGFALVGLVMLASLPAKVGICVADLLHGKTPANMDKTDAEYNDAPPVDIVGPMLTSELSPEQQQKYGSMMDVFSSRVHYDASTYAGWQVIPTTVVVSERDKVLDPTMQHEYVDNAISQGYNVQKVVLPGDHFVMISCLDQTTEVCIQAGRIR